MTRRLGAAVVAAAAAFVAPASALPPPSCPGPTCVTTCLPGCVTRHVEPLCAQSPEIKIDC